ncbi:MAG TPA: hypothetical protein VFV95_01200 [Vicinamibacterales bacterium]|nr:hypothetical protein [Vicinamibacterales bacterium]
MVPADAPVVQVSNIRKTYGSTVAVDDVSFDVREGEICTTISAKVFRWE